MSLGQYSSLTDASHDPPSLQMEDGVGESQDEPHHATPEAPYTFLPSRKSAMFVTSCEGNKHVGDQRMKALGKPTAKQRIDGKDITVAAISLLACALAIASVASNNLSWHLGLVYQLIVSGFLLGVMNLCLETVTPYLFLLLEARFGLSTLQNYNGILRSQVFTSQLSAVWRFAFCTLLALPLGLSATYKVFVGGQSSMAVDSRALTNQSSIYGWLGLPGLHYTGLNTGITLFSNATLAYSAASAPTVEDLKTYSMMTSEPKVPATPQAYGSNLLLLSHTSSAMLDLPRSSYLLDLQRSLAPGEAYTLSANIHGTVASLNKTFLTYKFNPIFDDFCEAAQDNNYGSRTTLWNGTDIAFYRDAADWDQSIGFIGFLKTDDFYCNSADFEMYTIARHSCYGHWNITRNSVQLLNGHCEESHLPPDHQLWITDNLLKLNTWYMPSLAEFLGLFSIIRPSSEWRTPSIATAAVAMVWSRVADLDHIGDSAHPEDNSDYNGRNITFDEAGMLYRSQSRIVSHRATLLKSGWLYCVFAIQPVLIILVLGLTSLLHSVPVGKGFGLITILAGVERETLDTLKGASLSGELERKVRLTMHPSETGIDQPVIEYHISEHAMPNSNGSLIPHSQYS